MSGRTYRFFAGSALYPFGHGLSYTTFAYSALTVNKTQVSAHDTVMVSVDITNTGQRPGDEVVQLYVQHGGHAVTRAFKDLRGFARVHFGPGEKRTVVLPLPVSSLAYWDESRHTWVVEREPVRIQVGASSADIRGQADIYVVP